MSKERGRGSETNGFRGLEVDHQLELLRPLYREPKEAREEAATSNDELTRLVWIEIAKGFERLAEQPSRDTVCGVERVKPKK